MVDIVVNIFFGIQFKLCHVVIYILFLLNNTVLVLTMAQFDMLYLV